MLGHFIVLSDVIYQFGGMAHYFEFVMLVKLAPESRRSFEVNAPFRSRAVMAVRSETSLHSITKIRF